MQSTEQSVSLSLRWVTWVYHSLASYVGTLRDVENCIHKLPIQEVGNMSNVLMEILRGLNESFRHLNL